MVRSVFHQSMQRASIKMSESPPLDVSAAPKQALVAISMCYHHGQFRSSRQSSESNAKTSCWLEGLTYHCSLTQPALFRGVKRLERRKVLDIPDGHVARVGERGSPRRSMPTLNRAHNVDILLVQGITNRIRRMILTTHTPSIEFFS